MTHDSLPAMWISDPPPDRDALIAIVNAVLDEDRVARDKDRGARIVGGLVMALFCPALLYCAAYGLTPLVRAGYALMAAGTMILVYAAWMYAGWARQGLPGPADARSQLQKSVFLLSRQANMARTSSLSLAPIFVGVALVCSWVYQKGSARGAYLLWGIVAAGWMATVVCGLLIGRAMDRRRSRMEQLLNDL